MSSVATGTSASATRPRVTRWRGSRCSTRWASRRRSSFPNALGIGGDKLTDAVPDEQHRLLLLQMFNDYNAEVQEISNNRLLPLAVMPAWDVDACVAEAERAAGSGCAA